MNHSQNNTTVIFLNFGISSKIFVIILKFDHKVMPSKDVDRNANNFNPDQTVSLYTSTVCTEKFMIDYFNDKTHPHKPRKTSRVRLYDNTRVLCQPCVQQNVG